MGTGAGKILRCAIIFLGTGGPYGANRVWVEYENAIRC